MIGSRIKIFAATALFFVFTLGILSAGDLDVIYVSGDVIAKKEGDPYTRVRKGGKFVFQDLFELKKLYGETDDLLKTITGWGISNVNYVRTGDSDFIPRALKLPFMVGAIGIIHGTK